MSWNAFVKDYLTFSKKDRIAVFAVLALLLLTYVLPKLFVKDTTAPLQSDPLIAQALDTLQQKQPATNNQFENATTYAFEKSERPGFSHGTLFTFDPNTLPAEGWQKLGLPDRVIRTINNYRNKGGHFYKREDVQKIWGLPAGFYQRVAPYIQIAAPERKNHETFQKPFERPERKIAMVNINEADTTAFIALPGIGSKLAQRIVSFRNKLGGFYAVEQLGETYGLPDSTFQKLKPYFVVDAAAVRKINLNTATKDELKTHPYLRWNEANAIVEYRNQHGAFTSLDELKNIMLIDEALFRKITPYLSL